MISLWVRSSAFISRPHKNSSINLIGKYQSLLSFFLLLSGEVYQTQNYHTRSNYQQWIDKGQKNCKRLFHNACESPLPECGARPFAHAPERAESQFPDFVTTRSE